MQLACCGRTRFLFHFDDVGCFESFGTEVGISMIYTMWIIGDKLRELGHFFTMTGRSALLRVIPAILLLIGFGIVIYFTLQGLERERQNVMILLTIAFNFLTAAVSLLLFKNETLAHPEPSEIDL